MHVYNADRNDSKNKSFVLKHLGISPVSAAERVEGMFAHQKICSIRPDLSVDVHDRSGVVIETKTLEKHLVNFCNYAKQFHISEYLFQPKRPLRLVDLWEDDPIGSAGPMVVDPNEVPISKGGGIKSIFYPFSGVIYPQEVYSKMSKNEIKRIKKSYSNNAVFKEEMGKRKARSKAIGEDFNQAQYQEVVWLDLTLKLRTWALSEGYDSFVYSNIKEGDGEDTFITLLPEQLKSTGNAFKFLEEKYLREMPLAIQEMVNSYHDCSFELIHHALWGQKKPMDYWELINSQ
ncbi:hypothetical protein QWY79_01230 [Halomonas sabkhae]|uniref:hypothetical protein n=1 Tax=Halomonas sabkhae TaxID=626223 RepID=UPI0025B602EF|nr:hypothetical protein [Halomonas sabkhae]MDN3523886.1 hypothetical protein [Halomonas sabkhae]